MPEGDTIFRIAARAQPVLTGHAIERVTTQGLARDLAGRTVTAVAAHGKHLVIELDDGGYLRIHLGMNGRFRLYDRGEGDAVLARTSPGRVSLAITIATHVLIWLTAPTVEIAHRRSPRHGMAIASLGSDILADDFDAACAARAAEHDPRPIGEVLLDQRVVAGIGNIYKCEALFAAAIDPRSPASALGVERLTALYEVARAQMQANLGPGVRTTRARIAALSQPVAADRYFVYRRVDRPCVRCGATIICYAQGHDPMRWTWSCPGCQTRWPA